MIARRVLPEVEKLLTFQPAVALLGPRQVGKTTLARQIADLKSAIYLDLEQPADRAKLKEASLFFKANEDRLMVLDEIHRVPELLPQLRGVIDEGRRAGKGSGRFILLGSASLDLIKGTSESLAGRISYLPLTPFQLIELGPDARQNERLWLRGGFPESYLLEEESHSLMWRRDFSRTYFERDIPFLAPKMPTASIERLWLMLAHRQGSILNGSDLARSLDVSHTSVSRYIDLLSDLFLVRRLPPFFANVGKRLTKSPKVYIRDSGLVHALLGIASVNDLLSHPVLGFSWEGFVIENLANLLKWPANAYYYRTTAGAEIDMVIEFQPGRLWAIEIKRSESPKLEKGFITACNDLKPERRFVVHSGTDRYPVGNDTEAIGLAELCSEVASA